MLLDRLISEEEAARKLGKAAKTLQIWRWRKVGPPYIKIGAAVRYDPVKIDAWVESQTVSA